MPEDAPLESVAWGFEGMASLLAPEVHEYLREIQLPTPRSASAPIRARMKGLTYGVYPNLSFLWSNTAFKVSHPRGPGKVEYWSWSVVPADAPEEFKRILRGNHTAFFGPGGILEQEDSEAWMQQFLGSNIDFADDRPYFYGLGLGEEKPHDDLPGLVSVTANEFYARNFFLRWRDALARPWRRTEMSDEVLSRAPSCSTRSSSGTTARRACSTVASTRSGSALCAPEIRYIVPARSNPLVDNARRGHEEMISVEHELEGHDSDGLPIRNETLPYLMLRVERELQGQRLGREPAGENAANRGQRRDHSNPGRMSSRS